MNAKAPALDAAFMEKQRRYLIDLRTALLSAARRDEAEEASANSESARDSRDYDDEAHRLTALELDSNLIVRNTERLEQVTRALRKIEEGSYGLSDLSGQPIPRERLEALPEAILTLAEEKSRERKG